MASNHTEACTAMRPGCDDEGACDCGYLDSVMREGYQKDYSTPPPAEMCPQCGEAERHAFECPVSVASREEFNAALREYVPKSAEPAALCLECDREQRIGKCPHKPAKAPQLSQAECEKVYAESQADIADLIKPAAAEVRVWWIDLDEPDIWFTSKGAPTHVIHVIEYSAYQAVCAERDEIAERHEIVSDTNKLKQMTIHELQSQRDQLRRELESLQHKHDGQYAHDTKALHEAHREITALKAENERLRAACKRNPSSGSCIEALSEK